MQNCLEIIIFCPNQALFSSVQSSHMLSDFYTFISTKVTNFNVSSDTMFEYGCTLPYQPSYLEIRRGHTILNQKLNEVSGNGNEQIITLIF